MCAIGEVQHEEERMLRKDRTRPARRTRYNKVALKHLWLRKSVEARLVTMNPTHSRGTEQTRVPVATEHCDIGMRQLFLGVCRTHANYPRRCKDLPKPLEVASLIWYRRKNMVNLAHEFRRRSRDNSRILYTIRPPDRGDIRAPGIVWERRGSTPATVAFARPHCNSCRYQ